MEKYNCASCGKELYEIVAYKCEKCGNVYCLDHKMPQMHNCRGLAKPVATQKPVAIEPVKEIVKEEKVKAKKPHPYRFTVAVWIISVILIIILLIVFMRFLTSTITSAL